MSKFTIFITLIISQQAHLLYPMDFKTKAGIVAGAGLIGGYVGNHEAPQYGYGELVYKNSKVVGQVYDDCFDVANAVSKAKWTVGGTVVGITVTTAFLKSYPIILKTLAKK